VTYGDSQLMQYTDEGGGVQWGPLRLSGQIMIGTVRYRGDIVSEVGPYVREPLIPTMQVSGSHGGLTVSGSCANPFPGPLTQAVGQFEWTFDWNCRLAVNGGPESTVLLRTIYTGGGGRCSGRACWGDFSGYFTEQ
jgi:hypothetical protein